MPDVGQRAFRAFFQWSYLDTPRLKPDMSLEDGLDLAELAQKYQVYGLKNQVSDLFPANLGWSVESLTREREACI